MLGVVGVVGFSFKEGSMQKSAMLCCVVLGLLVSLDIDDANSRSLPELTIAFGSSGTLGDLSLNRQSLLVFSGQADFESYVLTLPNSVGLSGIQVQNNKLLVIFDSWTSAIEKSLSPFHVYSIDEMGHISDFWNELSSLTSSGVRLQALSSDGSSVWLVTETWIETAIGVIAPRDVIRWGPEDGFSLFLRGSDLGIPDNVRISAFSIDGESVLIAVDAVFEKNGESYSPSQILAFKAGEPLVPIVSIPRQSRGL